MNKIIFGIGFILAFGLPWLLFYYLISKFTKSGIIRILGGFISGIISLYLIVFIVIFLNEKINYNAAIKAGFTTIEEHKTAKSLGLNKKEEFERYKKEQAIQLAEKQRIAMEQKKQREEENKKKKEMEQINRAIAEGNCRQDLKCLAEKNFASATVYCGAYIEKLAKYDFKWTDEGLFETKFSHFRWKDKENGAITYIGDKAMFQNGFGAWQSHIYECDFDTRSEKILDVRARPGRL